MTASIIIENCYNKQVVFNMLKKDVPALAEYLEGKNINCFLCKNNMLGNLIPINIMQIKEIIDSQSILQDQGA